MGIFSKWKKSVPEPFSLNESSFKTSSEGSFTQSEAKISLFKQSVGIRFDPTELEIPLKDYIEQLNEKLNWIAANRKTIEETICHELLETKNEDWLEEGEKEVSEKDFMKRLTLEDINFFDDSSAELYFNDGDLFWGHSIVIDLSADYQLDDIKLAG